MSSGLQTRLRLTVTLLLLGVSILVLWQRQYVADQLSVWRYQPVPEIQAIVSRSAMNERGTFLFYASHPRLEPRETFNDHCKLHTEKAAVLGCYNGKNIYLFNIDDQRLDGIEEVTAAHEMLHVAYDRLSTREKVTIHSLIDDAMAVQPDRSIQEKLDAYELSESDDKYNELHSILGTEAKDLPLELARYYDQYFINRLAIVSLFERYETVFNELAGQQKSLVADLNRLADEITSASAQYSADFESLQKDINDFNIRAANGGYNNQASFDRDRQALLSRQYVLTSNRDIINANIEEYTMKKQQLDDLNTTANDLLRSIDSRVLPEAPEV